MGNSKKLIMTEYLKMRKFAMKKMRDQCAATGHEAGGGPTLNAYSTEKIANEGNN